MHGGFTVLFLCSFLQLPPCNIRADRDRERDRNVIGKLIHIFRVANDMKEFSKRLTGK